MDPRLTALAAAVPIVLWLAANQWPLLDLLAAVVVPAASLAWAIREGNSRWAVAMLPGALVSWFVLRQEFTSYVALVAAGPVAAYVLASGARTSVALAWGAVPFALRSAVVLASGVSPFPEDTEQWLDTMWSAGPGTEGLSAERLAELRDMGRRVFEAMGRVWLAWETSWFWGTLVIAYAFARRLLGNDLRALGKFSSFDVSDLFVGGLILGLALILLETSLGVSGVGTVGWNLVFVCAVAFGLRGLAIGNCWLERAGMRRLVRIAFFGGSILLFLPAFALTTATLGLFDSWFDFRRIRSTDERENPLKFLGRSSQDDLEKKEDEE